jgi:CRP-like cAMP-binding protein
MFARVFGPNKLIAPRAFDPMSKLFEAAKNKALEEFFAKVETYYPLTADTTLAWMKILSLKKYAKGELLIKSGQIAKTVAFVSKGLFSQFIETDDGTKCIKRFFAEGYFAASTTSLLSKRVSTTSIEALEDSKVLEYDFWAFKALTEKFRDASGFYIKYMERHWIVEKEPEELALRQLKARDGFERFNQEYGHLVHRLKKQDIAAFLGITPTQMSRIVAQGDSSTPPKR